MVASIGWFDLDCWLDWISTGTLWLYGGGSEEELLRWDVLRRPRPKAEAPQTAPTRFTHRPLILLAFHPFRWTLWRHSSQHRQPVRDTGRRARCILYGLIIEAKPAELARPAERNYMFDSISWTSVGSMPHSSIMYGYTPSCSTTTTLVVDGTDASTRRAAVAAPCLFLITALAADYSAHQLCHHRIPEPHDLRSRY